jgi:hypothetical protein
MSKYDPLWEFIKNDGAPVILLSFSEIRSILGFDIDHSFLNFKKELIPYGYKVGKISLKEKTVVFERIGEE